MNNGYSRLQSINRFLYTMLTVFLIMPMFGAAITAFVPSSQTVAHADTGNQAASTPDAYAKQKSAQEAASSNKASLDESLNSANSKASSADAKSNSSNSDSSSSGSGDQDSSDSEWNTAVQTLSGTVTSDAKPAQGDTDQASYMDIIQGHNNTSGGALSYINIWGFMGPTNNMVWTQNDNSSWASSYEALMPGLHGRSGSKVSTGLKDAYQVAARFAYGMQSQGLDKPVKSGFGNISATQVTIGWLLQISYYILTFANYAFNILITLLQDINPLHWIVAGSQHYASGEASNVKWIAGNNGSIPALLQPIANAVSTYYDWFTGWGWAIMGIFLVAGLGMGALGITVGQSGGFTGQGRAIASTFVSFLKRLFVWVAAPVFAASIWDMATGTLANTFATTKSSVAAYAVYGAFDDYHNWVIHSRLSIPNGLSMGGVASSFNGGANAPLTHKDIVLVNYLAAGDDQAGDLYKNLEGTTSSRGLYDSDALNSTFDTSNTISGADRTSLTSDKNSTSNNGSSPADMLKYWTNGSKMTAADYGSLVSSQLGVHQGSDLSQVLAQKRYNIDGGNDYYGSLSAANIQNDKNSIITRANYDLGDWSADDVVPGNVGGLSTLGMYNYMLTTASDTGLTIANTENLADDVSLPQHYNINLVGTGLTATGNAVWALGLMGGLAIIVGGYALAMFKTIIHGLPAMVFAVLHSAFASVKGGVQLISVVTGLLLGTLGTAFMYRFAQVAFISLAEYSDDLLANKSALSSVLVNLVSLGGMFNKHAGSGALAAPGFSGGNYVLIAGALNIIYGLFLLFLAFMLLRYRGIVIDAMSSVVEETVNKVMASFGTLTGGSAGTRGGISQNTDSQSSNTWSAGASSLISRGGMGALMTAGGVGGLAALGKGAGKANASKSGVGAAGKGHSLGKSGDAAKKAAGQGTSASKTGNAAGATGTGKAGGKGTGTNAASSLGQQNSQRNGTGGAGKGLSGASQHAPAGQGTGHGTNGAHGATAGGMMGATQGAQGQAQGQGQNQGIGATGQTNGMGQDQSQGQQTGDNGVGNAAGGDMTNLSTNMNDTNQQNSDLSSIGGDNGVNTQNSDMSNSSQIGDNQSLGGDVSNNSGDMRTLGQDDGALQGGLDGSGQGVNGSSNNSNIGGTNLGGANTNSSNLQNLSTNGGSNNMNDLTNSSTQLGNGGLGQNGMGSTNSNLNNSENNQNGAHNNTNSQLGQTGANDNNNLSNSFGGSEYTDNDGNTQLGNDTTNTAGADTGAAGNLGGSDVTTNSSNLGDINNSDQSVDNGGSFNTNSDTNNATNNDTNQAGAGGINESNNSNLNSTTGGIQNMNQNGVGNTNANGGSTNGGTTMGATGNGGVSENNNSNLTSTTGGIQNMNQNGLGNANANGGDATVGAGATGDANANATGQNGNGNSTTIGGNSALTNNSSQLGGSNLQGDSLNTSQNSNLSNGGVNTNSQIGGANNNTNSTDGGLNNSINSNLSDGGVNNNSQVGGDNANTNVGGVGGNTTSNGGNSTNTGGTSINGLESTNLTNGLGGGDSSTIGGSQSIGGANNNSTTLGGSNMNGVENTMNNAGGNMSSQMGDSNNTNMGANNSSMNGLENNNVTNGLGNSTSSIGGDSSNTNIGAGNELNNNNSQISGNNNANALGGNTNVGNSSNLTGNVSNSNLNGDVNNSSQIGGDTNNGVGDGTQALNGQDGVSVGGQDGASSIGGSTSQIGGATNGVDTGSTIGNGFSGSTGGEVNQTQTPTGTGDANNNFATQTNDAGVSNVAGGLGGTTPVNNSITPQSIQSQMGGVQAAQNNAQQAQTLAQQNPDNQVLQQRADTAGQQLSSVQGSALTAYNSQPVSADTAQASWVSPDANQSQMSIGNVNTAMNNVYSAQQDLTSAQTQFGANSPQVQGAQTALNTARQGAVSSGLSEQVVSNPKAVASAHASINSTTNSLKTGNWRPTGHPGGGVSGGSANKGGQRSIGI